MSKVFDYTHEGLIRLLTGTASLIIRMWLSSWIRTKVRLQGRARNNHSLSTVGVASALNVDHHITASYGEVLQRQGMGQNIANFLRNIIGAGLQQNIRSYNALPPPREDGRMVELTEGDMRNIRHNVESRLNYNDTFWLGTDSTGTSRIVFSAQILASVDSILQGYTSRLNHFLHDTVSQSDTYRAGILTSKWQNERMSYRGFGRGAEVPWCMAMHFDNGKVTLSHYAHLRAEYPSQRYWHDLKLLLFPVLLNIRICEATREPLALMLDKYLTDELKAKLLSGELDSSMKRKLGAHIDTGVRIKKVYIGKDSCIAVMPAIEQGRSICGYKRNGEIETVISFLQDMNLINIAFVIPERQSAMFLLPSYIKEIEDIAFAAAELHQYTLIDPFNITDTTQGSLRDFQYMPLTTYRDLVVINNEALIPDIAQLVDFERKIEEHDDIRTIRER